MMQSRRNIVLKNLKKLVENDNLSNLDYLEVEKVMSTKIGLNFERITDDIWVKHLNEGKYIFLKEHEKPHFFNPDAKTFGSLIEGDNLPVLFLLQNIYRVPSEKIDLIYIDPPYNVGTKGFIYNNDYRIKGSDRKVCQVNEEDNFRHSKWLSMMEERIKIAKELLKDSGLIVISIDDNELYHLKLLMDHIFGSDCYKGTIIWKKGPKTMSVNHQKTIFNEHEYILVYEKTSEKSEFNVFIDESKEKKWKTDSLVGRGSAGKFVPGSKSYYPIINSETGEKVWPCNDKGERKLWRLSKTGFDEENKAGRIIWKINKKTKKWKPYRLYLDPQKGFLRTLIDAKLVPGSASTQGTENLKTDFDKQSDIFDYPKPINLLKFLIKHMMPKNGLVLDFFAGSGTTGCAVAELNKEDGGNRKFVLVTNNEGDVIERIHKNSQYCVFRDVLYPRLKNNRKKYQLSCKVFKIDEELAKKIQKNNETFASRQKEFIQTATCLLSILKPELSPWTENEIKDKKYCFNINGKKYGFFNTGLDVNMRFDFKFRKDLEERWGI